MGTRHVPEHTQGFILPDDRLTYWPEESGAYDGVGRQGELGEATVVAGLAEPAASTDLALRTSGSQEEDLEVLISRAGLPVIDGVGYLARRDGATTWEGCELPHAIASRYRLVAAGYQPHVIPVSRDLYGPAVLVVYSDATGAISSQQVSEIDGSAGLLAPIDATAITDPYPCLLRLPSGRILCYRWGDDGTDHQVRGWYSDDDGVTWTALGPVLPESVSSASYPSRRRLRAVYHRGVIGLYAHLVAADTAATIWMDRILQYASRDGGYTFSSVVEPDGSDPEHSGGYHDVAVWRGEIVMARLAWDPGSGTVEARVRRLPSPWYPWTSADELAELGGDAWGQNLGVRTQPGGAGGDYQISEGELALWADDETSLYLTGRHCAGAQDGASPLIRSPDGGETWQATGTSAVYAGRGQAWYYTGSAQEEASSIAACASNGRSIVVHTVSRSGVITNGLEMTHLGGWQDLTMPSVSQVVSPLRRVSWDHTWTAATLPDEVGYTLATVGAPTINLFYDLVIQTAAGETVDYTITPAGTMAQGVILEVGCAVVSGRLDVGIRLQGAGPVDYDCEVRVSPTTIQLFDLNGAAVAAPITYSGEPVAIRISMEEDSVAAYARIGSQGLLLPTSSLLRQRSRNWELIGRTAALVAGGGGGVNLITLHATVSSDLRLFWALYVSGAYCGDHLYTQPSRLRMPRSIVDSPSVAIYGLQVSSVSGPGVPGDQWTIERSAAYPYEAPLPHYEPSPSHPWRCSGDWVSGVGLLGMTGRLSYRVRNVDESSLGAIWGALIDGLSMGGVDIYLYYAGAWHLAGSVPYWEYQANFYGRTVVCSSGTGARTAVYRRDELAGCLFEVVDPATPESLEQHLVERNEPGYTDTSSGLSVPLRLTLDDAPVTPGPATVRIYPRRALIVLDLSGLSQQIQGVQLRWPLPLHPLATPCPTPGPSPLGYHQVSTLAPGVYLPLGTPPSHGGRLSTEPQTELLTAEDGTRTAYRRGDVRRIARLTWSDPVAQWDLEQAAPDVIAHVAGAPGAALRWRTPIDLADLIRRTAGAATPVVWCPAVDSGGAGSTIRWADGAFLGRITSAVDRDLVRGTKERCTYERVQDVTVEEEL